MITRLKQKAFVKFINELAKGLEIPAFNNYSIIANTQIPKGGTFLIFNPDLSYALYSYSLEGLITLIEKSGGFQNWYGVTPKLGVDCETLYSVRSRDKW